MEAATVLGSQHVEATRLFMLDWNTLKLQSLNGAVWEPGEIKQSVCAKAQAHGITKPHVDCTCGIWSCKSRRDLETVFPMRPITAVFAGRPFIAPKTPPLYVSARVEQWGIVIEHETGYRSEYARIIPNTIQFYPRPEKPTHRKLLEHLRRKYAVEQATT